MKCTGVLCAFALLSVFAWPLATAGPVSPSSISEPYCDHVSLGKHLVLASSREIQPQIFYHIFSRQQIDVNHCNIDKGHSLRIEFKRLSKVSDVLIEDLALGKDLSKLSVSLWRGNEKFECKPPKDEPSMSKQVQFHSFSCFENGAYRPDGFFANGVEIESSEMVHVNLTHLVQSASYGWLLLKRESAVTVESEDPGRCKAPALIPGQRMLTIFQSEYEAGEIVKFACEDGHGTQPAEYNQTCLSSGHWSPPQVLHCQPSKNSALWFGTIPVFRESQVSPGMTNVSLVAAFKRNIYSVSKVDIGLTTSFEKDEMKRLFDNNIVYQLMNANGDVIYEHRKKQVNTTEKTSITTTFPETVPHCSMCTVIVTFPKYNWNEKIVYRLHVLGSAGSVEHSTCPPIEPYSGMPLQFDNYELVINGSINELLLKTPCRYGYTLIGDASDINQCNNGSWIGKGFPRCEKVVRSKTPPEVEHATWTYVRNDLFDTIVYTCKEGYKPTSSGSGIARYSVNDDAWTDVPDCTPEIHGPLMQGATGIFSSPIVFIAGGALAACSLVAAVVVLTGMYLRRRRTLVIVKGGIHHVKQPIDVSV